MEVHISTKHLLVFRACRIRLVIPFCGVNLSSLQANVHKQQRSSYRDGWYVVMIPHRLHVLIILCTVGVIGVSIYIIIILVIGHYGMHLMAIAFITHSHHVVRLCCRCKVIRAYDALVIV